MKIQYCTLILFVFLIISCASNKSVKNNSSSPASSTSGIDSEASEDSGINEISMNAEDKETAKELSEAEQQAIELDAQRIQAEKDAVEERQRLLDLRASLAKFEEENKKEEIQATKGKQGDGLEIEKSDVAPALEIPERAPENEAITKDTPPTNTTQSIEDVVHVQGGKNSSDQIVDDYYSEGDFVIQFLASVHGNKNFDELSKFGRIIVEQVPEKSVFRYNIGYFRNRIEAEIVLEEIRGTGWGDAFVREK